MNRYTRIALILLFCLVALTSDGGSSHLAVKARPATDDLRRIRFDVTTFEEHNGRRDVISETTVEGPQGTDFQIKLQGGRFQLDAKFLTDLVAPEVLKVRADLNTRRLYGYSERNLPLYEEGAQKQALQLGFDEKLVLLPFGRNDNSDQLKIEITPEVSGQSAYLASGMARPLEIKILKASPGGAITVEASKVPHRFAVEAVLLEDGREVARGETNESLLEEPQDIVLKPTEQAGPEIVNNPIILKLDINRYLRSRPTDQIAIAFDAHSPERQRPGQPPPVAFSAAGIAELGSTLPYDLSDYYLKSSGRKYELRLRVKLAPGEEAN